MPSQVNSGPLGAQRRTHSASAPGKVIIFGEHAVVYGRPAIAVPVTQVRATVRLKPAPKGHGLTIVAPDIEATVSLKTAARQDPLAVAARLTLKQLAKPEPDAILSIRSDIPVASGLGSGAAVSTAIVRSLSRFLGCFLPPGELSDLVFEVEKIHHGTPSGVDNTVIAFERAVYFTPGQPIEMLKVRRPFTLLIADTGIRSSTRTAVEHVRSACRSNKQRCERIFDEIAFIAARARQALESGEVDRLGPLMNQNHRLLQALEVSSPQLEQLLEAARRAGATGAKLSGAGLGGNMIAQVEPALVPTVRQELLLSGASAVIVTQIGKDSSLDS